MKSKKVTVYMDGVDWNYEVGEASGGNKVYANIEDLKEYNRCWKGCGIVECEIKFKKQVVKDNWEEVKATSVNIKDVKYDFKLRLEHSTKRLEYLQNLVKFEKERIKNLKKEMKNAK